MAYTANLTKQTKTAAALASFKNGEVKQGAASIVAPVIKAQEAARAVPTKDTRDCKDLAAFVKSADMISVADAWVDKDGIFSEGGQGVGVNLNTEKLEDVLCAMLRKIHKTERALMQLLEINADQAEKIAKLSRELRSQES